MGDNLYCLSEVISSSFLVDYGLIYAPGGNAVGFRGFYIGKAFIVTKVKVCFMSVGSYVALAMFIGIEGARVNIEIRVKLLNCDSESSRQKQPCQR